MTERSLTFNHTHMKINARLKKSVIEELTMNPAQSNIEISVMLGVPERDVQKVRDEIAEKEKEEVVPMAEPAPAKKTTPRKRAAVKRAAQTREKFEAEKASVTPPVKDPGASKFYLRMPSGMVKELVRMNSSQGIVLLEYKEKKEGVPA